MSRSGMFYHIGSKFVSELMKISFGSIAVGDEVAKLQNHLALLREEYVKLQTRHNELERKVCALRKVLLFDRNRGFYSFVIKLF